MKRRDVLSVIGSGAAVGLAGCATSGGATVRTDDTTTAPPAPRMMSIESVETIADEYNLEADVELLNAVIDRTQTAEIRVSVRNTGPKRGISVVGGATCDLFDRDAARSDDPPGLWLFRSDRSRELDRKPGRWVQDYPQDRVRGFNGYGCGLKVYSPGETVAHDYEIWDDYRVDGYLLPGTYRWQEEIEIGEEFSEDEAYSYDDVDATVSWGFSISMEKEK